MYSAYRENRLCEQDIIHLPNKQINQTGQLVGFIVLTVV